jgi:hypothetical protein
MASRHVLTRLRIVQFIANPCSLLLKYMISGVQGSFLWGTSVLEARSPSHTVDHLPRKAKLNHSNVASWSINVGIRDTDLMATPCIVSMKVKSS